MMRDIFEIPISDSKAECLGQLWNQTDSMPSLSPAVEPESMGQLQNGEKMVSSSHMQGIGNGTVDLPCCLCWIDPMLAVEGQAFE